MNTYYRLRPWAKFCVDHNIKFIFYVIYVFVLPVAFAAWLFEEMLPMFWKEFKYFCWQVKDSFMLLVNARKE